MNPPILKSKRYWKTVFALAIAFILIFTAFNLFTQSWTTFLENNFYENKWIRFFISRIIGGIAYGMIMGYYFEKRKRKANP